MRNLFSILSICFLMAACANPKSEDDIQVHTQDRWNQQGNYEYDFREYKDGGVCQTNHRFNHKASFCTALMDREYNQKCALGLRTAEYKKHCGDDFHEINFKYDGRRGYDPDLAQSCESPASGVVYSQAAFCQFLKDENIHGNCFRSHRIYEYRFAGCE